MNQQNDFLILGAGYGGLTIAALLAKEGANVTVLEAHHSLAGCASWYQRGPYRYDVGATTLSGFAHEGPLTKLCEDLDLRLELINQSIGMVIKLKEKKILRHANHQEWIREMVRAFPQHEEDLYLIWNKWKNTARLAWQILPQINSFPPKTLKDWMKQIELASWNNLKFTRLVPDVFLSVASSLPPALAQNTEFRQFLDEQLIISTQGNAESVSNLIGALGLIYPSDTYYSVGGMDQLAVLLADKIHSYGSQVLTKKQVVSIEKSSSHFTVRTKAGEEFSADKIISNIPFWNHLKLGPESIKSDIQQLNHDHPKAWGALTAYFPVKLEKPLESLYFQIHSPKKITHAHGPSLFFSFSDVTDRSRAPQGWQTVTVSTHCEDGESFQRGSSDYKAFKNTFANEIEELFRDSFSEYGITEMGRIEVGTPASFERYTGRHLGRVGGLPHGKLLDMLKFPSYQTSDPKFYRIGDTVFPGQGVVGVVTGAYHLQRFLQTRYK